MNKVVGVVVALVVIAVVMSVLMERARRRQWSKLFTEGQPHENTYPWVDMNIIVLQRLIDRKEIQSTYVVGHVLVDGGAEIVINQNDKDIVKILVNFSNHKNPLFVMGLYEEGQLTEKIPFSCEPNKVAVINHWIIQRLHSHNPLERPVAHPQSHRVLDDQPN